MLQDKEYQVCKLISNYLVSEYPEVIFHYDYAGLNLSKAQSGKMKMIQGGKGWPDLFIAQFSNDHYGLFLEIKAEGIKLFRKDGQPCTPHISNQLEILHRLRERGYIAEFACGFDEAKNLIDNYLKYTNHEHTF